MIKTKVVILGDSGVGKSSILNRLKFDKFQEKMDSTIGCEFFASDVFIGNTEIKLLLWDTAGQEVFRSFTPNFLRGAKIAIIVYDLSNKTTLDTIDTWIEEAQKQKNIKIIFVGNKNDLDKSEYNFDIENCLDNKITENMFIYGKVSAKTGDNIKNLFKFIGEKILDNISAENLENNNTVNFNDNLSNESPRTGCCS